MNASDTKSLPNVKDHPSHPAYMLKQRIDELGITANRLALDIRVSPNRVYGILAGVRGITVHTSLRLGRYLGDGPMYWVHRQIDWDAMLEHHTPNSARELAAITPHAEQAQS